MVQIYITNDGLVNLFDSEEEFKGVLKWYCSNENDINSIVQHEKAHLLKSKDLGYNAKYGIRRDVNGIIPIMQTFWNIPDSDLIKIILAVEEFTEGNLKKLHELGGGQI